MPKRASTFTFESYRAEPDTKELIFTFVVDRGLTEEHRFTETIVLNTSKEFPSVGSSNYVAFDRALFMLHLALGVSYWKAGIAPTITVESGTLTAEHAAFWNAVYTKGLGEFFYKNSIDFRGLVQFPFAVPDATTPQTAPHTTATTPPPEPIKAFPTALVPLGGGKDSLVTAEVLRSAKIPFETFSLNSYPIIAQQVGMLESTHVKAIREIDPQLFELNATGAYNGHIPVSLIYACTAVVVATIQRFKYIVLSNEQSANHGNVEYLGSTVNHQWSKSYEFERLFHDYVQQTVAPDIEYFSVLRPVHELHIAQQFAQYPQWLDTFTSCNKNFSQASTMTQRWCGSCAKDLFVFTMLAPFVPHDRLIEAFGYNLFENESLLPLLQQLAGHRDHKPFDCVGTPEEIIVALAMTHDTGNFDTTPLMEWAVNELLPTVNNLNDLKDSVFRLSPEHSVPDQFQTLLAVFQPHQQSHPQSNPLSNQGA